MLLNIEKAYPEIVKKISVSRFRQDFEAIQAKIDEERSIDPEIWK